MLHKHGEISRVHTSFLASLTARVEIGEEMARDEWQGRMEEIEQLLIEMTNMARDRLLGLEPDQA